MIESDLTPPAERVFERDPSWAAPVLWRSEMRNILTLYLRRQMLTLDETFTVFRKAEAIIQGREHSVDNEAVLRLAAASGCTAYDCEFIEVAQRLGVPLVTSDKKLLRAFPGVAVGMAEFVA